MKHVLYGRSLGLALGAAPVVLLGVLTSGCGTNAIMHDSGAGPTAVPALTGSLHGGQQPVVGATIQLWAVGMPTSGGSYGAGQTALISSAVTTTSAGGFTITGDYTCPSGAYVYITGTGGQPEGNGLSNSGLALMAALGQCSNLSASTFITINEATTVAGVWALQQFATATYGTAGTFSVGAPSTNLIGLQNAFGAANNIANTTTGAIPTTTAVTGTVNGQTVTVTVANEYKTVATLANILASCVNSVDSTPGTLSSSCTSLFNAVQISGQSAPSDTLQAALAMAQNPTNVGSSTTPPYNLSSSTAPFQPTLTKAPSDFTLGLNYGSTTEMGTAGAQNWFLYGGYGLAIDGNGNVYNVNGPSTPATPATSPFDGVSSIAPTGAPVQSISGGQYFISPRSIAIDTNNNAWVPTSAAITSGDSAYTLFEFNPAAGTYTTYTYANPSEAIAIDGANDVFIGSISASKIAELPAGSSTVTNISPAAGDHLYFMAFDSHLNLWSAANAGSTPDVYEYTPTCAATCTSTSSPTYSTAATLYATALGTTADAPDDIAIDKNNVPWIIEGPKTATINLTELNGTPTSGGTTTSPTNLGGIDVPQSLAMDGASNIWLINQNLSLSEIEAGSTTVALSPSTGFTNHTFAGPANIAIDQSGNVWVDNSSANSNAGSYPLTEIVGAAVPAVQPLAKAVALGKIGQAP